jgi:hypothetical protein
MSAARHGTGDMFIERISLAFVYRGCVYRKPKPGCTGGEVRQGRRLI